jgi:hypothetical protein
MTDSGDPLHHAGHYWSRWTAAPWLAGRKA